MKSSSSPETFSITENEAGVIFSILVQPRASRNEICGIHGGNLKIRLTSPPVEGAANKLCTEFFAKLLGIAKSRVTIIAGEKSRSKTLKVTGISGPELRKTIEDNYSDKR